VRGACCRGQTSSRRALHSISAASARCPTWCGIRWPAPGADQHARGDAGPSGDPRRSCATDIDRGCPVAGRRFAGADRAPSRRRRIREAGGVSADPFPRLSERRRAAADHLRHDRCLLACRHVLAGAQPFACAEHPPSGLFCAACAPRHISRHPDEVEDKCDQCGGISPTMHAGCAWVSLDREVRVPRGQRRRIVARVVVLAIGVCPECWRAAGGRATA